jgi:hypothetical protein
MPRLWKCSDCSSAKTQTVFRPADQCLGFAQQDNQQIPRLTSLRALPSGVVSVAAEGESGTSSRLARD